MNTPINILTKQLSKSDLEIYKNAPYENLIKFVVDIEKEIIALGGEMHADAEMKLLQEEASEQDNLWGANILPWGEESKLEYISLINIKPSQQNFSMEIEDEGIKNKVAIIVAKWIDLS
jgi:hypothetical protein